MPTGPFGFVAKVGVGVSRAKRIVLPAPQDPAKRQVRGHRAMHNAKVGDVDKPLQAQAPYPILKRGLGHRCDHRSYQQIQSAEEDGKCPNMGNSSPGTAMNPSTVCAMPSLISSLQLFSGDQRLRPREVVVQQQQL